MKSSRVISLSDDIARSMSAVAARVAVIPGRNVIGIELPNQRRETVYLREMFSAPEYEKSRAPLTLALGKTIGGEPVMADLAKMPHLADRGHDRLGQVGRAQHHDPVAALPHAAGALPDDHDRSQDAGIVRVRQYSASARARRDRSQEGGGRAQMGGARDGAALPQDGQDRRARRRSLQRARQGGQGQGRGAEAHGADRLRPRDRQADLRGRNARARAHALHRRRGRRDGRPDDDLRQGDRRRGAAPGADGARRRHPSDRRDAAPVGRRDHRHDQGELPDPHQLPGHLARSTAAPSSASRAPSSSSARATCST